MPDAVKNDLQTEELPAADEVPEEAIQPEDLPAEEPAAEEPKAEEPKAEEPKTESLHEGRKRRSKKAKDCNGKDCIDEADCKTHKVVTHPEDDSKALNEAEITAKDMDELFNSEEFKTPISEKEVEGYLGESKDCGDGKCDEGKDCAGDDCGKPINECDAALEEAAIDPKAAVEKANSEILSG